MPQFTQAQAPAVMLEMENVEDLGSEIRFEVSLYAQNGHLLNFAQGDLSIAFDASQFGPDLEVVVEKWRFEREFPRSNDRRVSRWE